MEDTMKTFHRVFSVAGVSVYAKTNWDSKSWLALQIFNFIIGLLTIIFSTGFVVVNRSDINACLEGACIWTMAIIQFTMLAISLVSRTELRQLLAETVIKDAMLEMPLIEHVLKLEQGKKLNKLKVMVVTSQEKLLKISRELLKAYIGYASLCAILYMGKSVKKMFVTEDESLRLLGFDMWIPWSLQDFNVYRLTFAMNVYSGLLCCFVCAGFQVTVILLLSHTIRQLRILTFILANLDELVVEMVAHRGESWQWYCSEVLHQCVSHFINLNRNKLNTVCQPFYLVLILDVTMMLCVCSVNIVISDKMSLDTAKYYIHGSCFLIVSLVFCLLGQQVENEIEKLEQAVTEKWYIFDRNHKISVRIFHMALSQGMPIYIFGSIRLSAPTYIWLLKTSMSFFTLVMTVFEEK